MEVIEDGADGSQLVPMRKGVDIMLERLGTFSPWKKWLGSEVVGLY